MKSMLVAFLLLGSELIAAKDFNRDAEIQAVMDQVMGVKNRNVIDPLMLYYVFFDSSICQTCNNEVKKRWKAKILKRMCGAQSPAQCHRFQTANKKYTEHFDEVAYQYQFTGDDYYQSNAPFARSAKHIVQNDIMVGCDDAAKAFIQIAIEHGYSKESMRIVFGMADSGFESACDDNIGNEARRWRDGGHTMVAIKRNHEWILVNTTSKNLDYIPLSSVGTRLSKIDMPSLSNMPIGLMMAAYFPVNRYLEAFLFDEVKNIYVSGTPNSSVCAN